MVKIGSIVFGVSQAELAETNMNFRSDFYGR